MSRKSQKSTDLRSLVPIDIYVYNGKRGRRLPPHVTKVKIQSGIKLIKQEAFRGYKHLECVSFQTSIPTSTRLPESVTFIGSWAFWNCESLSSITLPNTIISIGRGAFWNCQSLPSIVIPDHVTSIGNGAFKGCRSLVSITLPSKITSIGYEMFRDCSNLSSITLPSSVTSIGERAFYDCTSLTSITIPPHLNFIHANAFTGCKSLSSITLPPSLLSIGDRAFRQNHALSSITIPSHTILVAYPSSRARIGIRPFPFDRHTKVMYSYGWARVGPCVKVRKLMELGRATPSALDTTNTKDEDNEGLDIIQYFIVHESDDIFRFTLEFVIKHVEVAHPY